MSRGEKSSLGSPVWETIASIHGGYAFIASVPPKVPTTQDFNMWVWGGTATFFLWQMLTQLPAILQSQANILVQMGKEMFKGVCMTQATLLPLAMQRDGWLCVWLYCLLKYMDSCRLWKGHKVQCSLSLWTSIFLSQSSGKTMHWWT